MSVFDEIAEKQGDAQWDEWKENVLGARDDVSSFVSAQLGRSSGEVIDWFEGSFNFCLRVMFDDGSGDAVIRFPGPGHTTFRDEKVANEVQVILFLQERTQIPVPKLLSWGLTNDSLHQFGPFIISEFVEGVHLSDILKDPESPAKLYLDPNIDGQTLNTVFRQLADILLQLFEFDFNQIGAISSDSNLKTWHVTGRPLTYSMNELATTAFYPIDKFSDGPFQSASEYFKHLCKENLTHLYTQRNLSSSEDQAADQYVVRHFFTRLIDKYCIDENGPFKLFCDDLRPQNILVNPKSLRITAVLDLEFTNAMPSQFASDPPWWLLLVGPDSYLFRGHSIDEFFSAYETRLDQFLEAMRAIEQSRGLSCDKTSLSSLMRDSWTTKRFWFSYAVRKPFDIEVLFNNCLRESDASANELDEDSRAALAPFVEMKMKQLKAYDQECARLIDT